MNFISLTFIIFALCFYGLYFLMGKRGRIYFILLSSYIFYGWWDVRYLGLILMSTAIDYVIAKNLVRVNGIRQRKLLVSVSVLANLTILFIFKYFNFFAASFQALLARMGMQVDEVTLKVLLPVGISFYTFQTMGYTIDVYRHKVAPEKDPVIFAAYVAFFPQLVAGPIERAGRLLPQLRSLNAPVKKQLQEGAWLLIWGYFLKMFVADNLARIVDVFFKVGRERLGLVLLSPQDTFILTDPLRQFFFRSMGFHLTALEIFVVLVAFALQIYGDFAGYSNIARGLAKLLGIDLMLNFRQPYLSKSPAEFWQRWHISLSTWLRDYLYIPLGGNRHGLFATCRNLLLTMLLGGLWHGASWVFVIWGGYHGILLLGQRLMGHLLQGHRRLSWFVRKLSIVITPFFVLYGWLIFRSKDLVQLKYMTLHLFTDFRIPKSADQETLKVYLFWVVVCGTIVLIADILQERKKSDVLLRFDRPLDYVIGAALIFMAVVLGGPSTAFIYFQF